MIGIGVSLLPFVPTFTVPPDVILVGVLPPLLFSAAVQLPAIEFRRDFRTISGLAIVLVLGSALALGVFFWLVIPSVGFPLGVALGAILSPTDAVATSIAKRLGKRANLRRFAGAFAAFEADEAAARHRPAVSRTGS